MMNCQPPSVVQCVYFPFVCMYCGYVYKELCVLIHPIQCPHVLYNVSSAVGGQDPTQ